jgi:serine/threonine-protein kinase
VTTPTDRLTTALAGRYRVDRELGQGGMATVYLAHDVRHDRDVAIKVVHQELAAALGAERFLAEIKTTARLQHPHILPLLDSGDADGLLYYVMPYVAGESLRDRLQREKQLPIEDAVRIAREVADALGSAHAHGIVHRDIKPENILLQGGHALVADFGIALAVQSAGGTRLTQTGLSLGTPQYMSPEQAMGDMAVDARSDLYALGAVTYEMITGEPPFTGATIQSIVAKVLSDRPRPPSMVRETVPQNVEAAVLKALAKLPADRFSDATAFASALVTPSFQETRGAAAAQFRGTVDGVRRWKLVSAGLAVAVLGLAAALVLRRAPASNTGMIRAEIDIGLTNVLTAPTLVGAPDGRSVAYCDGTDVWVRRWEDFAGSRVRAGPGGCFAVAFSPTGQQLAIIGVPTSLRIVSLTGEAPPRAMRVAELPDIAVYLGGIEWASDGNIYIASRAVLLRVKPDGGDAEVVRRDSTAMLHSLDVLPDARASLVVMSPPAASGLQDFQIGIIDHASGRTDVILQGIHARFVEPDRLLVARDDGALVVVPFDVRGRRPTGPATALADSVAPTVPMFDVTKDGTLVYWRSGGTRRGHPVFVDRSGAIQEVTPSWTDVFLIPRLSPDGSRMAVEILTPSRSDTWLRDLRSGQMTRLTSGGSTNGRPTWKPDGRSLMIISDRAGAPGVYERRLDDATIRPLRKYDPRGIFGTEWSRDGQWLVLRTDDQAPGKGDILAARPGVDTVAVPIAASADFAEYSPSLSPDGKWLAYVTNSSGRYEVWVTTFPVPQGRWQVSSTGGTEPLWSRSGRELFFITEGHLVAAAVQTIPEFQVTSQQRLFSVQNFAQYGHFARNYDVTPDDRRFLMLRNTDLASTRLVAVFNWRSQFSDGVAK